ncbi:YitT family protein [Pelagovum pacificum]|uniref:YitT family protein n=1 Tax=Pelagovum pacificum TaxID=2588711 RepID=A0A5C5GBP6_9RHOB|nr:YitT family protein [Pelagovum pacificum]QQA44678.1 YitT family protein [Pelagovum pacificum]TNY32212.1 YitT family protein [Pelagovum pacificum]
MDTYTSRKHTPLEDAQGLLAGTALCAFALQMLTSLGLVTGQTAGLAVLISYLSGWSFGAVFFVVNLPFYWLGYRRMGLRFTLKTFASVALLSIFSEVMGPLVTFETLNAWLGAVMFGLITGTGLLIIFRHGGSLGGVGILALYLQDNVGIKAGWVQLGFDLCLFLVAAFVLPPLQVVQSLIGAVVVNLVIALNHRRDRYIAT